MTSIAMYPSRCRHGHFSTAAPNALATRSNSHASLGRRRNSRVRRANGDFAELQRQESKNCVAAQSSRIAPLLRLSTQRIPRVDHRRTSRQIGQCHGAPMASLGAEA